MNNPLKKVISTVIAGTIALSAPYSVADVNDAMRDMYQNTGVMGTARAGGITADMTQGVRAYGGGAAIRIKTSTIRPFQASLPSVSAGCGSIDFHGGSMSFISGDELIAFWRNVAANAASFAFSLAIKAMSEMISSEMKALQAQVRQMNEAMLNSCELSKGIVTNTADALASQFSTDVSNQDNSGTATTGTNDTLDKKTDPNSGINIARSNPEIRENVTHNATWHSLVLQENALPGNSSPEVIMSVVGTVVYELPPDDQSGKGLITTYLTPTLSLREFIEGGEAQIYDCDFDQGNKKEGCLNLINGDVKTTTITGFKEQIDNQFKPDGSSTIFEKLYDQEALTGAEESTLELMNASILAAIYRKTRTNTIEADMIYEEYKEVLALEMAFRLVDQYIDIVERSLSANGEIDTQEAQTHLRNQRESLYTEYELMKEDYPSIREIISEIRLADQLSADSAPFTFYE